MSENQPRTEWARRFRFHEGMMEAAEEGMRLAMAQRCPVVSQGIGGRCSADASPAHEYHRCHEEDMPYAQRAHQDSVDGMAHVIGRVLWALDTACQYVTRKVGW